MTAAVQARRMKGAATAKLIYSATMSLDGYIAGPGGDMSWLSDLLGDVDSATAARLLHGVGALLVGNTTFRGDDPNKGTDAEGELDEILMFVAPVLLGDGTRAFPRVGDQKIRLERLPDIDEHWYRVIRSHPIERSHALPNSGANHTAPRR